MRKAISPVFFLLAAACFFLPFFTVTCQGAEQLGDLGELGGAAGQQELEKTYTGFEVVTGDAESDLNEETGETPEQIPGVPQQPTGNIDLGMTQIFAIVAAAVAILGIFLSLMPGRTGGITAAVLGVVGAIVLFLTGSQFSGAIDDAVGEQAAGFIQVKNEYGFWLSLVAFLVAAAWGVVMLIMGGRTAAAAPARGAPTGFGAPAAPPPSTPPPSAPPPTPPGGTPPPAAPPPTPPPTRSEDERP